MSSLHVDFLSALPNVRDIRRYNHECLNTCFRMIHADMLSEGYKCARIHLNKDGRWVLVGTYGQDGIRGLIDDDLCN